MKKSILISIIIGGVVVVGVGAFLIFCQPSSQINPNQQTNEIQSNTVKKGKLRDMMGQYSFGLDVCSEVGSDFISSIIKKPVLETKDIMTGSNTGCQFITQNNPNNFVAVYVEYLDQNNIRKGNEMIGRKIETNPKIEMDHFVVIQDDGKINGIYLIMSEKKFVRVDHIGTNSATDEQLVEIASKLVDKIMYE